MRVPTRRFGFNAVEMIVAIVLLAIVMGGLLVSLPAARERSRRAGCQANLAQLGKALALYHQSAGHLPSVTLGERSPIVAMLDTLGQPDFATIRDASEAPKKRLAGPVVAHRIGGLLCPTDRNAMTSPFSAATSYRANTGATTDGQGGPFAIGRTHSLSEVEAADGASHTAAFSERLVGAGTNGLFERWAYASVPGPIGVSGCVDPPASALKGDAGATWLTSEWRSTLYNHVVWTDSPACIALDGRTAFLGASSDHTEGFHVLLLDGSLRTYRRTVSPAVWNALGTVGDPAR